MKDDNFFSQPFSLFSKPPEDTRIKNMKQIIRWLENKQQKNKGVLVAIVQEEECMFGFIQYLEAGIQVNGFMSHPFIDVDVHKTARTMLALEFLDMASSIDKNILFLFEST
jgi:hypothetical protein